jgi:hypothetical protein
MRQSIDTTKLAQQLRARAGHDDSLSQEVVIQPCLRSRIRKGGMA